MRNLFKGTSTFLILLLFFSTGTIAQTTLQKPVEKITVQGKVTDTDGLPVTGVSVTVSGTQNGTNTDYDGNYKITVLKGQTLCFSFVGFVTQNITVRKSVYDIVMELSSDFLDQVVITGYSKVEVRKSTGSVAVISSNELKDSPLKNADQLLQGKLAGVNVQLSSHRPGATAKVRIRGTNTITGNAEPLWVIDGVPIQKNMPTMNSSQIRSGDFDNIFATGIGSINPNDIESITVLKDAAAAAIYGSQGANGVIVVNTKRGEVGKIHINYSGSVSLQTKPSRSPNLMNSSEKLSWEQELWDEFSAKGYNSTISGTPQHYPIIGIVGQIRAGKGRFAGWTKQQQDDYIKTLSEKSTDWFDVIFRNSFSTSHNISASGGTEKATYYISGSYNKNNGIVLKTSADSYTFNGKIDLNPTDFLKFGFQTNFSYQDSKASSGNVNIFKYAYFANPYERLYNSDGSYRGDETYFSIMEMHGNTSSPPPPNGFNIMREIKETSSVANSSSISLRGDMTAKITKGLTFNGLASFTYSNDLSENINGANTYAAWQDRPFESNIYTSKRTYGSITQYTNLNRSYILRGQFNWSQTFGGKHNINMIGGSEIRGSYAKGIITKRYGYDSVTGNYSTPLFTPNSDNTIGYDKLVSFGNKMDGNAGQNIIEDAFASFYATSTYSYSGKYIFSGTLRSDGSNNFGSNEQFNLNWSVSGTWNIDKEKWFERLNPIFSSLGIRAGFGYTGGVNKNVYPVLIMNYNTVYRNSEKGLHRKGYISNAPNPNLRWEKNRTLNIGLNFGFFNDRITGEFSYYRNKNLDQVTSIAVPSSTGFTRQSYNTSEQINNGVEFLLGATILKYKDFRWRISANFAYNYNELTKYNSPTGDITGDIAVGYPLGKIFTGKTTGISPESGLYEYILRPDITPKDISDYRKYQNYLFYIGTSNAPFNGGFSTTFTYKRLSVNIVGNYSLGGKIINNITPPTKYTDVGKSGGETIPNYKNDLYSHYLNADKRVRNRWTENNPITNGYPRLIDAYGERLTDADGNLLSISRPSGSETITNASLIENVSYLKLSSLSISYSLPAKWAKAIKASDISTSFLMSNLFILTNYSGFDPESPGAVYPQSRSFTFSLSIGF